MFWHPFLVVLPFAVLAGVAARHLAYLLAKLAQRLRASLSAPFPTLLVIVAADCAAITLASSLILAPHAGAHMDLAGLRTGVLDLLAFKKLTWTTVPHDTVRELIVALTGLLFYTAVVRTLLAPGQYSRTGVDFSAIAWALLITGRVRAAQEWALRDKDLSRVSLSTRASIAFVSGDFKEALSKQAAARRAAGEDDSVDFCAMALFTPAFAGHFRSDDAMLRRFFSECLDAGVSDPAIIICLINATSWKLLLDARPLSVLLPRLAEDKYPMSRSMLLGMGDPAAARDILERAQPRSEIEKLLRLTLLAQSHAVDTTVSLEDRRDWIRQWANDALPALRELSRSIPHEWQLTAATGLAGTGMVVKTIEPATSGELIELSRERAATVTTPEELGGWLEALESSSSAAMAERAGLPVAHGRAGITGSLPSPLPPVDGRVAEQAVVLPEVTVRTMCVSSDGFVLAVADDTATVHVLEWDIDGEAVVRRTIEPTVRPRPQEDLMLSVADDGEKVATAAGRVCEVWNGLTGERLAELRHPEKIEAMATGPDGSLVVTSDVKGRLRLWDLESGAQRELNAVPGRVNRLAIGIGDLTIAGTSAHGGVGWVWYAWTGTLMMSMAHEERGLPEVGLHVSFSGSGDYVLTAFGDGTACAWSVDDEVLAVRLRHKQYGDGPLAGIVRAVAMSEDDTTIVTAHTSGAWLWDTRTGEPLGRLSEDFPAAVGFTHLGNIVLASRNTPGVRVIRWTPGAFSGG